VQIKYFEKELKIYLCFFSVHLLLFWTVVATSVSFVWIYFVSWKRKNSNFIERPFAEVCEEQPSSSTKVPLSDFKWRHQTNWKTKTIIIKKQENGEKVKSVKRNKRQIYSIETFVYFLNNCGQSRIGHKNGFKRISDQDIVRIRDLGFNVSLR